MAERTDTDPIQTQREVWLRACAAADARKRELTDGIARLERDLARAETRRDEEEQKLDELIAAEKAKYDQYKLKPQTQATPEEVQAIEQGGVFADPDERGLTSGAVDEAFASEPRGVPPLGEGGRYIALNHGAAT